MPSPRSRPQRTGSGIDSSDRRGARLSVDSSTGAGVNTAVRGESHAVLCDDPPGQPLHVERVRRRLRVVGHQPVRDAMAEIRPTLSAEECSELECEVPVEDAHESSTFRFADRRQGSVRLVIPRHCSSQPDSRSGTVADPTGESATGGGSTMLSPCSVLACFRAPPSRPSRFFGGTGREGHRRAAARVDAEHRTRLRHRGSSTPYQGGFRGRVAVGVDGRVGPSDAARARRTTR